MATNIDAPFGLRPHNLLGSAPNSMGLTKYKVQTAATAGSSSQIFQGDMVIPLTNGLVDVSQSRSELFQGNDCQNEVSRLNQYIHIRS